MSFLDKAKERATQLSHTAKEKIDDVKDKRRVDELLADLGRIVYRQRGEGAHPDDDAAIGDLVAQLRSLEAEGTKILGE